MAQATQRGYTGEVFYRWHVWLRNGVRSVSWATSLEEAWRLAKARERDVVRIEPAPHRFDEAQR